MDYVFEQEKNQQIYLLCEKWKPKLIIVQQTEG